MKFWLAKKVYEVQQKETIEERCEREMVAKNLKYEVQNAAGKWEEVSEEYFESDTAKGL